ncbi:MAG: 50S ribosomal protein L24 [Bdellovibrionales bacterium]|nr:50S ribosomal protein L24 [Bdellovibrionales bacterium]
MAKDTVSKKTASKKPVTKLRVGDPVMVLSGGNKRKGRMLKSQTGRVKGFASNGTRVTVEGLNMIKRHKRALTSQDSAGIIEKEGSVHLSNVMYYSEQLGAPVRIKMKTLDDGRKVRGFLNPKTKSFEQIDL